MADTKLIEIDSLLNIILRRAGKTAWDKVAKQRNRHDLTQLNRFIEQHNRFTRYNTVFLYSIDSSSEFFKSPVGDWREAVEVALNFA